VGAAKSYNFDDALVGGGNLLVERGDSSERDFQKLVDLTEKRGKKHRELQEGSAKD